MWKLFKSATGLDRERRMFQLLVRACLVALIIAYAVGWFVTRELGFGASLERPLELAALYFIIEFLARIEDRLPEEGAAKVTVYKDVTSFYKATRSAVKKCHHRIYVTYTGAIGPSGRNIAFRRHIEACQKWVNASEKHSFRRVIFNIHSPLMTEYLLQELAEVKRARAEDRSYLVRVITGSQRDINAVGLGIYDYDQVFISYFSGADRMVGIGIRSREVVRDCFEHYYNHLWDSPAVIDIDKSDEVRDLSPVE